MRQAQRRKLLNAARAKSEPLLAAAIHKSLQKRFKQLKREIRRVGFRKRLAKDMIGRGLMYKDNGDEPGWEEWAAEFEAAINEALTFTIGSQWDAETRWWDSRGASAMQTDPQSIIDAHEARTGRQITDISDQTRADALQEITDWFNTDESRQELIDRLESTFGEYRAMMIARTETTFMASQVNLDLYNQFGVGYFNVDRDPSLPPACDKCQAEIDANPHETGDEMPPFDPNCLCSSIPANEDGGEFLVGGDLLDDNEG